MKLIYSDRKQISAFLRMGWGREWREGGRNYKEAQGNFWGDVHYLDSGDDFTGVYICQNLSKLLTLMFFLYKFIYFWLYWVFVAARGLSLVATSGGYSSLFCVGFSLWWLPLLRSSGSRRADFSSCGTWALERRLSSCGARA